MADRPQAVLRLEPHQIPALRAAFEEAARSMDEEVRQLSREGAFGGPWLGDPASRIIKTLYDRWIMGGEGSAYRYLTMYRDELVKTYQTLDEMDANYRRTEGDNAALWGQRA